jgi:hypothetical protein
LRKKSLTCPSDLSWWEKIRYFSVHNFLNRENITFALLKAAPHVKYWWENFYEKKEIEESSLFTVMVTWESFRDAIKQQYYPIGGYDDLYTK